MNIRSREPNRQFIVGDEVQKGAKHAEKEKTEAVPYRTRVTTSILCRSESNI
jgi:hypothetical protein